MKTLSAMFKLFDGYSSTISKIDKKTKEATDKIINASGATDKFNGKLQATGASAGSASSGLGKFLSLTALIAGAVKGMSIADEYTNTSARLSLINDGLQTQEELQDKIFAAADRSRGAYNEMAGAVAKMGLLAKDAFGSNDELIAFTELTQKSFKIGGADTSEQQGAMRQLSQAMASGRLQGDELVSIMENAPMMYEAIAKYTGKSKGELKKMGSEGAITSDIIKNAMFAASDDINKKFGTLPMTFADVWDKIKNGGTKAFSDIMKKVNGLINTDSFQGFMDKMFVGFDLLARAAGWFFDVIIAGWDTIGPILGIIGGVLLIAMITKLWAMIPPLVAQAAAWMGVYWPIFLIIGIIAIAISAARQFGASWEQILGFVGGIIGVFASYFYNQFVRIWNVVAAFINFFGNVFNNPVASIKILFYDLANTVLGYIETMAKGIESLINKIPGVEISITSGLSGLRDNLAKASQSVKDESGWKEYVKSKDFMDYSTGYTKGSDIGKSIPGTIGSTFDKLTGKGKDKSKGYDMSQFGSSNKPIAVKGKGKGGKVDVEMSKEDMEYLRNIAERDYVNKFSTATLAPNVTFNISDIKETADINKIKGTIEKMMREEIAVAAEGVY